MRAKNKYIRRVLSLVPCSGKEKRWLRERISEAVAPCDDESYDGICQKLGEPEALAASCVEELGTAELLRKLNLRTRITGVVLAAALIALICWGTALTVLFIKANRQLEQTIIVRDDNMYVEYKTGEVVEID